MRSPLNLVASPPLRGTCPRAGRTDRARLWTRCRHQPAPTKHRLRQVRLAHAALGCRDLSRADFIVTDQEDITLLEVNTLPGMTPTSLYPDGARALGFEFAALIDYLVRRAHARGT